MRKLTPEASTIFLVNREDVLKDMVKRPEKYNYDVVAVNHKLLTTERVRDLHLSGWKVFGWTINEPEDIRKATAMGVDSVITDYPDRMLA